MAGTPNAVIVVLDGYKQVEIPPGLHDGCGKSDLWVVKELTSPSAPVLT